MHCKQTIKLYLKYKRKNETLKLYTFIPFKVNLLFTKNQKIQNHSITLTCLQKFNKNNKNSASLSKMNYFKLPFIRILFLKKEIETLETSPFLNFLHKSSVHIILLPVCQNMFQNANKSARYLMYK